MLKEVSVDLVLVAISYELNVGVRKADCHYSLLLSVSVTGVLLFPIPNCVVFYVVIGDSVNWIL